MRADRLSDADAALNLILRALSHPVRRRILRALAEGPGSASTLAEEFGLKLSVVSYHLNRVLAKEGTVELVETIPRRGSLEKVYRLKEDLWTSLADTVDSNQTDYPLLRRLSPGECFLEAAEALDEGAFGRLEGSAWEWFSVAVDEKVWQALIKARRDFNEQLEKAVEESRGRGQGKARKTRDVVVGVAAFPAARPGAR
jgi:DNA-binding transcriptional ArsR family regulator